MFEFDSPDKPLEDHEYPDDYDSDDDWEESDVVPCPHCGADVFDDAMRCAVCGEYVTRRSNAWQGKSWWWILLGMLGIAATVLALSGL